MKDINIPAGYKSTDIGVIPEDWEIKEIRNCTEYVDYRGKTPAKTKSGRFLVTAKNIREGFIDYEISKEYVAEDNYELIMRRGKPQIADILITTEAPLGNVAAIDREDIALAQRVIKYKAKSEYLDQLYLKHYFLSATFQRILDDNSSGSTAKGIKGSILHKLPVIIPPLPEQKAIATALSDMDNLLGVLDRLIAKKQNLKQAAMQELLTGKKRLPGFVEGKGNKETEIGIIPEDWNAIPLKTICKVNQGLQIAIDERLTHPTKKSKQYITIQAINSKEFIEYIDSYSSSVCCEKHDILMTRTGNTGIVVTGVSGVFHNNFFKVNFDRRKLNQEFFVYCLRSDKNQKTILEKAGTSTIPDLNHDDFYSIKIALPTFQEQKAIATILSDMDTEITALKKRRDKTNNIKQAMMQELLTGKTRLIAPEGN